MTKRNVILLIAVYAFSFLQIDCKDDPPVVPPITPSDTIIIYEKVLTDGEQPTVSPDGSKIAFVRNGDIWVMDTSGANQKQLTTGSEIDLIPRWKPDGLSIGFIRKINSEFNKGRLFSIMTNGGGLVQLVQNNNIGDSLVTHSAGINNPIWDWSPTGEYISYLEQVGEKTFINVANVQSNQLLYSSLTYNSNIAVDENPSCFAWSEEVNKILFIRQTTTGLHDIVLFNLLKGDTIINPNYLFAKSLCKQPKNELYAFRKSPTSIVVTNFNDSKYREIVSEGAGGLKWSLDGNNIIFGTFGIVSDPFGYRYSIIALYSLANNNQYLLTTKGDINITNYFFEWGGNSNTIFFERFKKINKLQFSITK